MAVDDRDAEQARVRRLGGGQRRPRRFGRERSRSGEQAGADRERHQPRRACAHRLRDFACSAFGVNCERSEEHTSELQSLMRISYDVFCLKKNTNSYSTTTDTIALVIHE